MTNDHDDDDGGERTQLISDINAWSDQRLRQWVVDSMDRFKMVDVSGHDAHVHVIATLFTGAAKIMAVTEIPADEIGEQMVRLVNEIRQHQKRRKMNG